MSTLKVDTVQSSSSNPTIFKSSGGVVVGTLCRASVSFKGTDTVTIRDSFNVSSITDNGTGLYTINFTNPMGDTDYVVVGSCNSGLTTGGTVNTAVQETEDGRDRTTSSFKVRTLFSNGTNSDRDLICIVVFGN